VRPPTAAKVDRDLSVRGCVFAIVVYFSFAFADDLSRCRKRSRHGHRTISASASSRSSNLRSIDLVKKAPARAHNPAIPVPFQVVLFVILPIMAPIVLLIVIVDAVHVIDLVVISASGTMAVGSSAPVIYKRVQGSSTACSMRGTRRMGTTAALTRTADVAAGTRRIQACAAVVVLVLIATRRQDVGGGRWERKRLQLCEHLKSEVDVLTPLDEPVGFRAALQSEPGVVQGDLGSRARVGEELEQRTHKRVHERRFDGVEGVLVSKDGSRAPEPQVLDVAQLAITAEELCTASPRERKRRRYGAQQLLHLCEVVLVALIAVSGGGVKEEV
jgi:hypothetical protein